jgi:hypothetical protein
MPETQVTCPNCHTPFELTAAMAASIEESVRVQYEAEVARMREAVAAKELAVKARAAEIDRAAAAIDEQVAAKVASERTKLAERARAAAMQEAGLEITNLQEQIETQAKKLAVSNERELALRKREREVEEKARTAELDIERRLAEERGKIAARARSEAAESQAAALKAVHEELETKRAELAKAQEAELELRRNRTRLEDEKRALSLVVQRQVDDQRAQIREEAQKQLAEEFRLKQADKDKQLADMTKALDDLKRKGEQGSSQAQGEVQELDLEAALRTAFPRDTIEEVAKGVHGGDVLQRVLGSLGAFVGTILWESKRTKAWNDGWLAKLRGDQRDAKAEVAVILTTSLPNDVRTFGSIDGVWVTGSTCMLPLASALRQSLIDISAARDATKGKQTKMELVYEYMTGPVFRHRIEAIKEAFEAMQEDLTRERAMMQKQWAKREKQIGMIISGTVDMYGELQGIVGRSMPTIDGLDLPELPEARRESATSPSQASTTDDSEE